MRTSIIFVALTVLSGCAGKSRNDKSGQGDEALPTPALEAGPETLPTSGALQVQEWLEAGHYLRWTCEELPHPPKSPSEHGTNRTCSNALHSSADENAEFPVGAAAVKEMFGPEGVELTGYAVYMHFKPGTTGDTWYWFEQGEHSDAHGMVEPDDVEKEPVAGAGVAECVLCHGAAPTPFVWTQVRPK